ncbi:hypothetical protein SDC9_194783 [bioreactor metagenome]|uniref:Uncharacterized protein n=1 Tax=bioreactor metagenome TaxID=1076179 RepID=A0A645I8P5_9ZZZZ
MYSRVENKAGISVICMTELEMMLLIIVCLVVIVVDIADMVIINS